MMACAGLGCSGSSVEHTYDLMMPVPSPEKGDLWREGWSEMELHLESGVKSGAHRKRNRE
jgi:hypothetical protein